MASSLLHDDFNDNTRADFWYQIEDDPSHQCFAETSQRLELHATAAATEDESCGHEVRGCRLYTNENFAFRVDWSAFKTFAGSGGEEGYFLGLGVGVSRDTWAAIGIGYYPDMGGAGFWVETETNGQANDLDPIPRAGDNGTLYVSYDAGIDRLYLSVNGYYRSSDPANGDWVVDGLLQGTWNAGSVAMFLEGGAEGVSIAGGEAYFDDFVVNEGSLFAPPTFDLEINSTPNAGVSIELNVEYNGGLRSDTTPFDRTYDDGMEVRLTASATDGAGNSFVRWLKNGVECSTDLTIGVVANANDTYTAVYEDIAWIVDNSDDYAHKKFEELDGTWTWQADTDAYMSEYVWAETSDSSATASGRWSCTSLPAGRYKVSAWWVAAADRSTTVPYVIKNGATELDTVTVDQTQSLGNNPAANDWRLLGVYSFDAGQHVVEINNGFTQGTSGEETICADAVRFERVRKGDFDADGDVDSVDFDAFKATYHSTEGQPTPPYNPCGDFDDDGKVDFWDFMEFTDVFGM